VLSFERKQFGLREDKARRKRELFICIGFWMLRCVCDGLAGTAGWQLAFSVGRSLDEMVNEGKKNSFRSRGFDCFKMMMVGK
jgi:hypothetical protein